MEMLDKAEKSGKMLNDQNQLREDSEYVRLVISNEPRLDAGVALQPQAETKYRSYIWWIKAISWCFIVILVLLIFVKWGVPFLFEKVFPDPFLQFFSCEGHWVGGFHFCGPCYIHWEISEIPYKSNVRFSPCIILCPVVGMLIHLSVNM